MKTPIDVSPAQDLFDCIRFGLASMHCIDNARFLLEESRPSMDQDFFREVVRKNLPACERLLSRLHYDLCDWPEPAKIKNPFFVALSVFQELNFNPEMLQESIFILGRECLEACHRHWYWLREFYQF